MSTALDLPEPDPADIARRLRMHMGDKKISRNKLAVASGIGRTPLAYKLDGHGQFTVPELLALAHALGKSWLWVMTGTDLLGDPDPGTYSTVGESTDDYQAVA